MIVVNQRKERQLIICMKLRSVVGLLWLRGRNNSRGLRIQETELFVASVWGGGGEYKTQTGLDGDKTSPFIHGSKSYSPTLGAGDILGSAGGSSTYLPDRAGDHTS